MDEGHRFVMVETRNHIDDGTEKQLVRYQLHNHLGSAALELEGTPAAKVISYEEYHPFGSTAYQAINKDIKSEAKRYRFIGMERDEETGLEYHSARYYLPWLGRWVSSDPIGINAGINFYAYVKNNPIMQLDSTGTEGETCGVWDEESLTCYAEECPIVSTPQDEAPPPSTPPGVRVRRRSAQPPTPPTPAGGTVIEPPPPVSPTDYTLYVPEGVLYTQYKAAQREVDNSDNPWYTRAGFFVLGTLSAPVALAEEYVARPLTNVPFVMHNAGRGIGEHTGRAVLWAEQGETGEAFLEGLHAVKATSEGMVAGLSVGAPVAGVLESRAASAASTTLSLESTTVAQGETKLLSQFSTSTIDDAVSQVMKDPNKIGHLFPAKHNLGPLVTKLGGQENTVRAVLNAANGKLPASGIFRDIPVIVGGKTVLIRGNVINGVPRLGTMFIK